MSIIQLNLSFPDIPPAGYCTPPNMAMPHHFLKLRTSALCIHGPFRFIPDLLHLLPFVSSTISTVSPRVSSGNRRDKGVVVRSDKGLFHEVVSQCLGVGSIDVIGVELDRLMFR